MNINRTFNLGLVLATGLLVAASTDLFLRKMPAEQRAAHALNRLTFGARPGDIDKVRQLGVDKWVDLQLNPEKIAESPELAAKLKPLSTLGLTPAQVAKSYPTPQLLAIAGRGGRSAEFGTNPEQKAMIGAFIARYSERYEAIKAGGGLANAMKAKKADPSDIAMTAPEAPEMAAGDMMNDAKSEKPKRAMQAGDPERLAKLLTADQLDTLRTGSPAVKAELLRSLPADKLGDVVVAMPPNLRRQVALSSDEEMRRKMIYASQPNQLVMQDMVDNKIYRAVYSERQLEEVLVDFWYNHFNVFANKNVTRLMVSSYERDAIRPHVLGKFRDLLGATAHHPAMLHYLDNDQSVDPKSSQEMSERLARYQKQNGQKQNNKGKPNKLAPQLAQMMRTRGLNENYARELMELHTLGVDAGYTQKDVTEVARAFTGWGFSRPALADRTGRPPYEFAFAARQHDQNEKVVLGERITAGGQKDGEQVLQILANHPATARHISHRLAQRFVADAPPEALVKKMTETFQRTGGDLRQVMRTMTESTEFWSEGANLTKVKSPLEMVISAIRAVNANVTSGFALAQRIGEMGQPLYQKVEPTGYKNIGEEWVSSNSLVARMNFSLELTKGRVLAAKPTETFEADPQTVARHLLGRPLSASSLQILEKQLVERAAKDKQPREQLVAGLVLGSPEFQRR